MVRNSHHLDQSAVLRTTLIISVTSVLKLIGKREIEIILGNSATPYLSFLRGRKKERKKGKRDRAKEREDSLLPLKLPWVK